MKQLNFAPCYAAYLRAGTKTVTLRAANRRDLAPGDSVMLTVGWEGAEADPLGRARIVSVQEKAFGALEVADLAGESPDCGSPDAARLVLSCLYRRVFTDADPVVVIRFEPEAGP